MKKTLQYLIALCCFLAINNPVRATHLMGGNLTYTYIGQTGSLYNYEVTLKLYRYCASGSSNLPNDMNLGIYEEDTLNPNSPKSLVSSVVMPLISQQYITPPSSDTSCHFTTVVCVEEGVYQTTISVSSTIGGYHLISDRCCRNNNIANLDTPQDAGQAYYAFMPPTNLINNSPTFAAAPVPFLCQNDTVGILNSAFDADGDSLAYSFVVPYNGIATPMNNQGNPPNNYPWPIPIVTYANANYSVTQPFGTGSFAAVDGSTGLTTYFANTQGYYVVAVEIREYRNGVLVGVTRRDLQIIVIVCPVNPAPQLASAGGTVYTVLEGQNLCFNTDFTDSNGDSLYLFHSGDVFNSAIINPTATLTDVVGDSTLSTQFCWTTGCNQGRNTSYQFSITVNDNGCPAKTTNIVYTINVINTPKPASMSGIDTICSNQLTGLTYSVPSIAGYTFNWVVTNGAQVSGAHTHTIGVDFTGSGIATVSAITINPYGCPSDTLTKTIYIRSAPAANAGTDVAFCSGASTSIGTSSTSGITYSWSPSTGLSSNTISNPTVTLTNATSSPIVNSYIVTTNSIGCSNTDTVLVTVAPIPTANAGNNVGLCSNTTAQLGTIVTSGYTYSWSPSSGLSNSAVSNPLISLVNSGSVPDTFYYAVIVQNVGLCRDTDTVRVVVNPVPTANAGSDVTYCSGDSDVVGFTATSGYTYSWLPTTSLSSNTISNPTVNATNATQSVVTFNYAVITTWFGCRDTDSVAVNVKPLPISNAGTNTLLCSGNISNLGTAPTTGYTYVWAPPTGLSNINLSNPTLTLTNTNSIPDTLQYYVTTTLNGCTTSDTVRVVSSPVPIAVAGTDVTFCSGQSASIGSSTTSGYTYSWSPATGISSPTIANPTVTLTNATTAADTTHLILITTWFGCQDRDTVDAIVKPLPLSEAGANTSLCDGDTINLGTTTTAGYTYVWTPATLLSNATISNPQLIVSNAGPSIDTLGYLVSTTLNGCTTTDTTTILVNPLPVVQATATPTAICLGASTTLNGTGAATYNWATSTNPTVSIGTGASLSVSPMLSTTYIATGTSTATCTNTTTVSVTVNSLPNVTATSANDTICNGDTLQLNANGASTYTWYGLGSATSIGTGSSILVSPTADSSFVVQGTDGNSCQNRDTIRIVVSPAATISIISGTVSLCPGVTGVVYYVNNSNPNSTYQWSITNGTLVTGQGNDTATIDWPTAGAGTITVIETTTTGCRSHPVVLPVTINTLLTPATATGPQVLCANQASGIIYFSLQTTGSNYTWHVSGGNVTSTNPTTTANVTINWTLTGPATGYVWYEENDTTSTSICYGVSDSIDVTINPVPVTSAIQGVSSVCVNDTTTFSVTNTTGNSYQWSIPNGTIISGSGTNTITVVWTTAGNDSIIVSEINSFNCRGARVFQLITVNALPNAFAGADASFCVGNNVQLQASGGTTYVWTPATGLNNAGISNPVANPSSTTTYTVLVTDANGCKKADDIIVTVNSLPNATAGADTSICLNSSASLNAGTGVNYSYVWSPNGSLTNSTTASPTANPTTTTQYTVVVTDGNSCVASDSVTVTVNALPTADAGQDTSSCNGTPVTLSANGGTSFLWSPAAGLSSTTINNPVANPIGTTTYTVEVTDVNGCKDIDDVEITINAQPIAGFVIDTILGTEATCNGVLVKFTNTSEPKSSPLTYYWQFGDGGTSTEENPTHLFDFSQTGNIILTATIDKCSSTYPMPNPVQSLADYLSKAPNVVTPNDDGKNDCFRLGREGSFDDCSEMKIFNRWGKLVFETDATHKCWNGRNKSTGTDEPEGVYFYVLRVKDFQLKGTVELIR